MLAWKVTVEWTHGEDVDDKFWSTIYYRSKKVAREALLLLLKKRFGYEHRARTRLGEEHEHYKFQQAVFEFGRCKYDHYDWVFGNYHDRQFFVTIDHCNPMPYIRYFPISELESDHEYSDQE